MVVDRPPLEQMITLYTFPTPSARVSKVERKNLVLASSFSPCIKLYFQNFFLALTLVISHTNAKLSLNLANCTLKYTYGNINML